MTLCLKTASNGIDVPDSQYNQPQPHDKEELLMGIRRRRNSVSATRDGAIDEWLKVKDDLQRAGNEPSVRQVIEVKLVDRGSCSVGLRIYRAAENYMSNYAPLVPKLPRYPQPHAYDGAPPGGVGSAVRAALGKVIQPSATQPQALLAPNFFLEFNGPGGEERVAVRQLLLDCANGVRGIEALGSLALLPPAVRQETRGRGDTGRGRRR
jgi:hypothetical protein